MNTPFNEEAFTLFQTKKECWSNFDIIENYREISDFNAWAMRVAFKLLFPSLENKYVWVRAGLESLDYDNLEETVAMRMTKSGILVIIVRDKNTCEQTEQYVAVPTSTNFRV